MISSGWREKRKVNKGKNVIIVANRYLEETDTETIYTMIESSAIKKKVVDTVHIYQQIKISDCSNYDFNDCNIYVEGLEQKIQDNVIKDSIRNCLFFNCTIISSAENNIQFRYCMISQVDFDLKYIENLDFSACVMNGVRLGKLRRKEGKYEGQLIDHLSFNSFIDDKAILNINNVYIFGYVDWIWYHGTHMISLKKMTIHCDNDINIACLNGDFIYNAVKNKTINIINDKFTIHDYAEEQDTI